jgi:hypothetical protein
MFQLEQDEGTIIGHNNVKNYIRKYYKMLFGAPAQNYTTLVDIEMIDIPQISHEDSMTLIGEFIEKGVYEAIMKMGKNKAPIFFGRLLK